jgi:hypothetical protein
MLHGGQGDLGFALQRPGVVPTNSNGAPINHVPLMSPMYVHHQIAPQPQNFPVHPYVNSSNYNAPPSTMRQFPSAVPTAVPTQFINPPNHHSHQMPDHYPASGSYPHHRTMQMAPPQQYQSNQRHDPNTWNNMNYGHFRGGSM